jgi:general secretion pathway protein A
MKGATWLQGRQMQMLRHAHIRWKTRFESRALLNVTLAADACLIDKLRRDEVLPLGSRIGLRLALGSANSEELIAGHAHKQTLTCYQSPATREATGT